jgi:hypothetical protein
MFEYSAHTFWGQYFVLLALIFMSLSWIDMLRQEPNMVVERCSIDVYHAGNRIVYIGKGEVWK